MTGNKTGPKPRFNRKQAISAALELRLDQFTMSQVAQALGVAPSALYRVFASREELLAACLDQILDDMGLDQPNSKNATQTWQQILRNFVETCWQACERYPGLAQVIMLDPNAPSRAAKQMEVLIHRLNTLGVSKGQALFALDFLGDIVFATHIAIQPYRQLAPETLQGYTNSGLPFEFREQWTNRGNLDEKVGFIITALSSSWPELQ